MEPLKHECGVAMIRLLKPISYYKEKYGTSTYGLNKLYLLMRSSTIGDKRGQVLPAPTSAHSQERNICCANVLSAAVPSPKYSRQ